MKTYCPLPFSEIYSDNNGDYKLCCHATKMSLSVNEYTPFEYWNSDVLNDLRDRMLAGEKIPQCDACWKMEKHGKHSWRHKAILYKGNVLDESKVSLKLRIGTNFCNLACYMCNIKNSSTKTKEHREIFGESHEEKWLEHFGEKGTNIHYSRWNKTVEDIINNIDKVQHIHLTGGEPLQLPKQWELLEKIPDSSAKDITISFDTNLTKIEYKENDLYKLRDKFKDIILGISCDHYGEKLSFIRYPINTLEFEGNLAELISAGFKMKLNLTLSILNVDDLLQIYKHYNDLGIEVDCHAVVQRPVILSVRNLPQKMKDEYLEEFKVLPSKTYEFIKAELNTPGKNLNAGIAYIDTLAKHRKVEWRKTWSDFYGKISDSFRR